MMTWRLVGSILLIIGTCIGAGILALPLSTATVGFYYSSGLLVACWAISTLAAFYLLEVNLKLPNNSNIISMAARTLGRPGKLIAWILYLLLLYSLLAAYLAGGSDVVRDLTSLLHIHLPNAINTLLFLIILGYIVFRGIHSVDWANRGLMIAKLGIFLLLSAVALPHITAEHLNAPENFSHLFPAVMIVITSFGFSIIIPSLRIYLHSNTHYLRLALFIGSLTALACYLIWLAVVQGTLPQTGPDGLTTAAQSSHPISFLTDALSRRAHNTTIASFIHLFTSICMLTSFLGVSLSLSDFLMDGLQTEKKGWGNVLIYGTTFLPPLLLILFFPDVFIKALNYAGFFCVILLISLPILMAWRLRQSPISADPYQVWGGAPLLLISFCSSILLLVIGVVYLV